MNARQTQLDEIRTNTYYLTTKYRKLPGLLWSLDHSPVLATPVAEPRHPDERPPPRTKPSSRPPLDIDWPSSARQIRDEAVEWDQVIRSSYHKQRWQLAFRSITLCADLLDDSDLRKLWADTDRWRWAAETLLGYLDPVLEAPRLYTGRCFDCGAAKVWGVALSLSAWCYGCGAEYSTARIRRLLIRQSA